MEIAALYSVKYFAHHLKYMCVRHDMAETFRACLGLVYTCYTERLAGPGGEPVRLETLVRKSYADCECNAHIKAQQDAGEYFLPGWELAWNISGAFPLLATSQVFPWCRRSPGSWGKLFFPAQIVSQ